MASLHPITPREQLNFDLLNPDIPQYWFDSDPYKTRFWDALSLIFPPGEKFFMVCVRDFKSQITDPVLLNEIQNFHRQEAQHSLVHRQDNERLARQGIDVERISSNIHDYLFNQIYPRFSKEYNLALTAALEHFTSITAHSLFDSRDIMKNADPRLRAMYSWHAIEEVEHKAVAFDVLKTVGVSYFTRAHALARATILFPKMIHLVQRSLLIHDGFSPSERRAMSRQGLIWLFGPSGILAPMMKHYFPYYLPNFHPWQHYEQPGYEQWISSFNRHQDPILASEEIRAQLFSTP